MGGEGNVKGFMFFGRREMNSIRTATLFAKILKTLKIVG
jgi:hypothetical protein